MYKRILVPYDGSPPSIRALEEAVSLALDQKALLGLVHIADEALLTFDTSGTLCWEDFLPLLLKGGESLLTDASARARARGAEVETFLLQSGAERVAQAIVEQSCAWGADLIVMGTHGRRGLRRVVMGSDAEEVVRSATVPVLLVGQAAKPAE